MHRMLLFSLLLPPILCSQQTPPPVEGSPLAAVLAFCKWYGERADQFGPDKLFTARPVAPGRSVYELNGAVSKELMQELKGSGLVNEDYLRAKNQYFLQCDKLLRAGKAGDHRPDFVEVDAILYRKHLDAKALTDGSALQDVEIDTAKCATYAAVRFTFSNTRYLANLDLKDDRWLIEGIMPL